MAFRPVATQFFLVSGISLAAMLAAPLGGANLLARAQVFVVGEKSAMADVSTDFSPTRVELPSTPITERGRRDLIRNLEAEQGFAHRALPLGDTLVLVANGNLRPGGDAYKEMLYKKGQSAAPGDRVVISTVVIKPDRLILDLNGGPYLKHRFLRHIQLNDMPLAPDDGAEVTGCRVTLLFEGGLPEVSAPEVKALLDPIIDFGVKTSEEAYADSLPLFLKDAIAQHDVLVGMNRKMVLAAMGPPQSKVRELVPGTSDKHYEEWIYGQMPQTVRFVRFVGDRVTELRIAALGKPIAIHDRNELQGYLDPEDTHEIAMGDSKPAEGDTGSSKPPTILKPGESAPGGSRRVLLPVSMPPASDSDPTPTVDPSATSARPGPTKASPIDPSASPTGAGVPQAHPPNQLTASVPQ
jgi:hypothetical protein